MFWTIVLLILFCPQLFPYPGQDPRTFSHAPLIWIMLRSLLGGNK
jgi:hypothetical protein